MGGEPVVARCFACGYLIFMYYWGFLSFFYCRLQLPRGDTAAMMQPLGIMWFGRCFTSCICSLSFCIIHGSLFLFLVSSFIYFYILINGWRPLSLVFAKTTRRNGIESAADLVWVEFEGRGERGRGSSRRETAADKIRKGYNLMSMLLVPGIAAPASEELLLFSDFVVMSFPSWPY